MAGHSKWANIKHKKGAQDAKRAKVFQKISKEILIAIKEGNSNSPDTNPRLRLSIEKAKASNMPHDNIKKLLDKSNKDTSNWKEVSYEGYSGNGIAIMVVCLTDNINRTSASIKAIFNKFGGNLGTNGSVSYLFENKGLIVLNSEDYDVNKVIETSLNANILDVKEEDDFIIIETLPNELINVKNILEKENINNFISVEIAKVPFEKIELSNEEWDKLDKLIDALEDNDDVQEVYNNAK